MDDVSALGTPWSPRTRQEEGRRNEQRVAKRRGTRLHPGSGSGSIRRDASNDEVIEEYKLAGKSFRLKGQELRDSYLDAVSQGKDSIWVIEFDDAGIEVEVRVRRT